MSMTRGTGTATRIVVLEAILIPNAYKGPGEGVQCESIEWGCTADTVKF